MKKLILFFIILISIKAKAQTDTAATITIGSTDNLTIGSINGWSGFLNETKKSGTISETYDTIPFSYFIVDTTKHNNILNGTDSAIFYVIGYKVIHRKGEVTYWADHSCPSHMPGCCVYHIRWIKNELPIINAKYISKDKKEFDKKYIIIEPK